MSNSEQPVNCPLCKYPAIKSNLGFVKCIHTTCDLFHFCFTLEIWNKAFGPKEIDWSREQDKFAKWYSSYTGCEYGDWFDPCWDAWSTALENRDE